MRRIQLKSAMIPLLLALLQCHRSAGLGQNGGEMKTERAQMVQEQIADRGVRDELVLKSMGKVPRHLFVEAPYQNLAYSDGPLPIGNDQTISQPYIVGLMTELLTLRGGEKVLEIGTGCGYQAAVLSEIADQVYTIEIVDELCKEAAQRLNRMNYRNVHVKCGDGYEGWPAEAPFDGIVVTAAPPETPKPLLAQLKVGGRIVLPVGEYDQELIVITRGRDSYTEERILPVRFVPMTGKARETNSQRNF